MHTVEALRAIRALESVCGLGNDKDLPRGYSPGRMPARGGEIIGVLKYNLETGEIVYDSARAR
jgi:hypothetical protein